MISCKAECKQQVLTLASQFLNLWTENGLRDQTPNEKISRQDAWIGAIRRAAQTALGEKNVTRLDESSELFRAWMKNPWAMYS